MKIIKNFVILLVTIVLILICALYFTREEQRHEIGSDIEPSIELSSTSFQPGALIDKKYSCKGENSSPQLSWSNLPEGTKSLALIAMDYDAPSEHLPLFNFTHWLIYNIPPESTELVENIPNISLLPNGSLQGKNGIAGVIEQGIGYTGPCPPVGTHRYFIRLYSLDTQLKLDKVNQKSLLQAMDGHILAMGETSFLFGQE